MGNHKWRVLIIDDREGEGVEELVKDGAFPDADLAECEICESFDKAIPLLDSRRIDLIILDLRDDSMEVEDEKESLAGLKVFDQIRARRFVPVIFHTAYPKHVEDINHPYVRVTRRDEPENLISAIWEIFSTGLPHFMRHIENDQCDYMWRFVQDYWGELSQEYHHTELTFLLGRRLASILQRESIQEFLKEHAGASLPKHEDGRIHPLEMYIIPPTPSQFLSGDIIKEKEKENYFVILTPSCDLVQNKAEQVLLAKCQKIDETEEYQKYLECIRENKSLSNTIHRKLEQLIGNNRQGQRDRYRFLPGIFYLPDLIIDFQQLTQISVEDIEGYERVASLDSPFGESLLSDFARYYGRLGTPDLDREMIINRIQHSAQ